jgi:hypothetical protein
MELEPSPAFLEQSEYDEFISGNGIKGELLLFLLERLVKNEPKIHLDTEIHSIKGANTQEEVRNKENSTIQTIRENIRWEEERQSLYIGLLVHELEYGQVIEFLMYRRKTNAFIVLSPMKQHVEYMQNYETNTRHFYVSNYTTERTFGYYILAYGNLLFSYVPGNLENILDDVRSRKLNPAQTATSVLNKLSLSLEVINSQPRPISKQQQQPSIEEGKDEKVILGIYTKIRNTLEKNNNPEVDSLLSEYTKLSEEVEKIVWHESQRPVSLDAEENPLDRGLSSKSCDFLFATMMGYLQTLIRMRSKGQSRMAFKDNPGVFYSKRDLQLEITILSDRITERIKLTIIGQLMANRESEYESFTRFNASDFRTVTERHGIHFHLLQTYKEKSADDRIFVGNTEKLNSVEILGKKKCYIFLRLVNKTLSITILANLKSDFYACYQIVHSKSQISELTQYAEDAQLIRTKLLGTKEKTHCLQTSLVYFDRAIPSIENIDTAKILFFLIEKIDSVLKKNKVLSQARMRTILSGSIAQGELDLSQQLNAYILELIQSMTSQFFDARDKISQRITLESDSDSDSDEDDDDSDDSSRPLKPKIFPTSIALTALDCSFIPDEMIGDQCDLLRQIPKTNIYIFDPLLWRSNLYPDQGKPRWPNVFAVAEDTIIVPLNVDGNHWTVVIIYRKKQNKQGKVIAHYYDSLTTTSFLYRKTLETYLTPFIQKFCGISEDIQYEKEIKGELQPPDSNDCAIYAINRIISEYIAQGYVSEERKITRISLVKDSLERLKAFYVYYFNHPNKINDTIQLILANIMTFYDEYSKFKGDKDAYMKAYQRTIFLIVKELGIPQTAIVSFLKTVFSDIIKLRREDRLKQLAVAWEEMKKRKTDEEIQRDDNTKKQRTKEFIRTLLQSVKENKQLSGSEISEALPIQVSPEIKRSVVASLISTIVNDKVTNLKILTKLVFSDIETLTK